MLLQGEDPDAYDYAKISGVHAAAVNSRGDIVEILHDNKSVIDSRDKNVSRVE